MPIIVDTDPGWDDCLVLLLLLAKDNSANVVGITTVWGNESVQATTINARRMTYYCGRPDIAVHPGCMLPLQKTSTPLPCPPSNVVRVLPPLGTEGSTNAIDMLVAAARAHGPELTILAIGSMTNIAVAIRRDKAAMKTVGTLVMTGGTFKDERNHEFNLGCDARATDELLAADLNPFIIPFDIELTMNRGESAQKQMRSMGTKFSNFYADVIDDQRAQGNAESNQGVFDQLAALFALDRSIFNYDQRTIRVVNGKISDDPNGHPARVVGSLNIDAAYGLLFKRLGG